jgi:hypothetical protein
MKKILFIAIVFFTATSYVTTPSPIWADQGNGTYTINVSPYSTVVVTDPTASYPEIKSTLNKKSAKVNPEIFSFIISGHFHGGSASESGMPAASLMANLDTINAMKPAFVMSLGDLFLNVERDHKNYERYLFAKLKSPLFNAVGNHDIDNELYKKRYGKTFQSFNIGVNRFIILDSELDNGDIEGEQLQFLKTQLKKTDTLKNIFIFMHRTLWAEENEELAPLFNDNTKSAMSSNFDSEILPLIEKTSANSRVYLFSGSLGSAPASFFYHKYSKNITYIATAIRDLPRDAILIAHVNGAEIMFETFSLNSNPVLALNKYTVDYWKKNKPLPKPFNWRLVPLYIYQMITHRYFWYGIGYVTIGVIFICLIIRRRKKKRERKN